ncbi:MAG: stress response translation initiation inhibitor YciH [Ktedonobacterales bacterium]
MSQNGSRPVYVTGIGRQRYCRRCSLPEDQCRCRDDRAREAGRVQVPNDGVVRLMRDRKQRGGKTMTLVLGLPDDPVLLSELAKALKKLCGAGGTLRGTTLEIQGDQVAVIQPRLESLGFRVKVAGG